MLDINRNDLQVVKRRYVLVRISVALIKHYGQKATSRERIYLTYISWVMVYKEKQRQEPRGKDWVGSQGSTLCTCLFLMVFSACFFIQLWLPAQGCTTPRELGPPPSINQENAQIQAGFLT